MPSLVRRVALGLAARDDVREAVDAAEQARAAGLESVWFHDSYFERDAITYATAVCAAVPDIGVALGAVNPNTRHPVVLAMTVSALDDLAPGRITLGIGSGLPLRLAQMGLPYDPDEQIVTIEQALADLRALWAGERIPAKGAGPDIEPMFPPVHRTPLWVAGYRRAFHELAGRAADGYLARPAESVQGIAVAAERIAASALAAGRTLADVEIGGYLLCLVDDSRAAALDRAKREPFAIYMLAVQSDISLRRVGIDPAVRLPVMKAWQAGDYHAAAQLISDELVDAFLLCGTTAEIAARVQAYVDAGMTLPVLQPVVQSEEQTALVIEAARLYGSAEVAAVVPGQRGSSDAGVGLRRRAAGWAEIARPFSLTASSVPVLAAAGLAAVRDVLSWPLFLAALVAGMLLQVGTNVVNEIYDVRKGIDSITSPRASHALVTGRVTERAAFLLAGTAFAAAALIGIGLVAVRGWPLVLLGLAGLLGGWGYTAPPLQYKYRALGLPLVFLLMGPLMVVGGYFTITGDWSAEAAVLSIPIGLLVTAILHGNEWRDISEDGRAGISTLSIRAGRTVAHQVYVFLLVGAYVALAASVALTVLPPLSLLAVLSLPLFVRALRASELGAAGQQRAIAMIDLQTAQLHAAFGLLLAAGLAAAAVWQR
ncbi:MAG: 1,4-dihydroxy-2-naphthoate octaprenyltransferase [Frankiales bacterium]|nr:1,4-dihydroxy-2-naphthoate octaprenyltransferase [Frankiales bacterium]